MSESTGGARRPLFSAATRLDLLAQVVGQPSGVIVELGGLEINLVALPFAQDEKIIRHAQTFGAIFDEFQSGKVQTFADAAPMLVDRYHDLKALLKEMVLASVEVASDDGAAVFDEWWNALPPVQTIGKLVPAVLQANGLAALGKRMAAEAAVKLSAAKGAPSSPSPMPQDT
jgi:hypothetical protein